jgi:hypothetical protein
LHLSEVTSFRDQSIFDDERPVAPGAQFSKCGRINETTANAKKRIVHGRRGRMQQRNGNRNPDERKLKRIAKKDSGGACFARRPC